MEQLYREHLGDRLVAVDLGACDERDRRWTVDAVHIVNHDVSVPAALLVYSVPPHSVTALQFTRAM